MKKKKKMVVVEVGIREVVEIGVNGKEVLSENGWMIDD